MLTEHDGRARRDGHAPDTSLRSSLRVVIAVECALVMGVLCATVPTWWAERWVQDDAYVSFRYARNLVRGHGLVYNVGEPVEGYTNFLWTLLAAAPLALGAEDPLSFMHLVSLGCWIGSYALLLALGVVLARAGVWAAPLAVLPLAVHWSYNMWFFSGMETPLVSLLTIAAVVCVGLDPARHRWALFGASAAGVGLMMTRPDGVVVVAALALAVALLDGRRIVRERRWLRGVLAPALPILLVFLPYQLWRLWFYGSLLPNTYYAKVAYLPFYERGWSYARGYVDIYDLGWFLPCAVAGLARPGPARRFLVASVLASAAAVFYVVRLGGDFMEWRFLTPISGVLYPAVPLGAAVLGERLAAQTGRRGAALPRWAWFAGTAVALALTMITARAGDTARARGVPGQETIASLRRYIDPGRFDWRAAAETFDAVIPAGARIATTSAGIVPYYCDRPCLDLHGLTDPAIARSPIGPAQRGRMGHEHWLQDYAEMRRRGVDVVLEWVAPGPHPKAITTPPSASGELMSVRTPSRRYIDFTLLNPELGPRLRADPRIVAFDPARLSDRRRLQIQPRRWAGFEEIDALDWGSASSEAAHGFAISPRPDSPADTDPKTRVLYYRRPREEILLQDDGRRVVSDATWQVEGVDAERDLVVLARFDHLGEAIYDIDVNGQPVRVGLGTSTRRGGAWGEVATLIPRALLRDGTNRVRISRRAHSIGAAAWYYMWFLQRRAAASSENRNAIPSPLAGEGQDGG